MLSSDHILKELGSDSAELSAELFAAAAGNPDVLARMTALIARAVEKPGSLNKRDVNVVSWAGYVFAENGSAQSIAPLVALGGLKAKAVRPLIGAYADFDLPCIYLRLGGADVVTAFGPVVQTFEGAPEVRIAPILAAGAAWAHGLISRDAGLLLIREELARLTDEFYADAQDEEWFDTVLDAALELHPAGLEDALEALREDWDMQEDWDEELAEALEESEAEAKARLRDTFPLFTKAIAFVDRWEQIDAEAE